MRVVLVSFCFILAQSACNTFSKKENSGSVLSKVKIGMTYPEVLDAAGAPDTIIHLGVVMDTFSNQTKTDQWYYSPDELIIMVNDTVNAIDLHARETQLRIQHMIDSARAAESNQ